MRPHFDLDGVVTAHRGPTKVVRNFSGLCILRPADGKLSAVGALDQKLGGFMQQRDGVAGLFK